MKHRIRFLPAAAALLAALLLAPAAHASRGFEAQITEANGEALVTPYGLAVDDSDNLWVSDTGSSLVSKFDSSGGFLSQNDGTGSWEGSTRVQDLAFGQTVGLVYAVDSPGNLWGLNQSDATYAGVDLDSTVTGSFLNAAVDNTGGAHDGDIYIGARLATNAITRIDGAGVAVNFSGSATYISNNQITGTPDHPFSAIQGVAVAANGDIWVADQGSAELDRFDPTGVFQQAITFGFSELSDVAIDPTNGDVLVGDTAAQIVREYDSSGNFVEDISGEFTPPGSFVPHGLAVDSTGKLYVADPEHQVVDVFSPLEHSLEVEVTGNGEVECEIEGGPAEPCEAEYPQGTQLSLTPVPAAGNHFVSWSGACTGAGACELTLEEDTQVSAGFEADPPPPPGGGGDGGGSTPPPAGTPPPVVTPPADDSAAYGQCVSRAVKAYRKARKAAAHKRGKAKGQAMKAANRRKAKAIAACKAQFK